MISSARTIVRVPPTVHLHTHTAFAYSIRRCATPTVSTVTAVRTAQPIHQHTCLIHTRSVSASPSASTDASQSHQQLHQQSTSTLPSSTPSTSSSNGSSSSGNTSGAGGRSWTTKIGIAFFLSTAVFTVYLGIWQVKRRAWKQDLIDRRTRALESAPVELQSYLSSRPADTTVTAAPSTIVGDAATEVLDASDQMRRVKTRGRFLYDRTQILGPRNPPSADASSTAGKGIGYYLITPFQLEEGGDTIMVNRGWCSKDKLSKGQHFESTSDEDIVELVGVVRKGEQRPQFLAEYDPKSAGSFVFLDLPLMSQLSGVKTTQPSGVPVLIDALEVNGNRNRHMQRKQVSEYVVFSTTPMIHTVYAGTWFTLSAALVALTYIRFKKKLPITMRPQPRVTK